MAWKIESRPNLYARWAGAIYLVIIIFGGFSEGFVESKLLVSGDAAATAHNILASQMLWRVSLAGNLVVPLIAVVQLWIEYLLFRPVSRNLALLFVLFNMISLSVEAISKIFDFAILPVLSGDGLGRAFTVPQLYGLMHVVLGLHDIAFNVTLIFFGAACLISGYLIFISKYFSSIIGMLMALAGACYLIASFAALFTPTLSDAITPWILLPPLVGESSFCLWLLIKGVNVPKWRAQLGFAGDHIGAAG